MPAQQHESFHKPGDPDVKIWRYMNLTKFLWTLQKRSLYFARADHLGDPFEGHYTLVNLNDEDDFVAAQMSDPELAKIGEERHRENFKLILRGSMSIKPKLFVSCWRMNENESLAMWKLYAAQQDSVCIQSRCSRLDTLLPSDAFLGMVNYIDYNTQSIKWGNALEYITHKRMSFAHERELRAVIWQDSMTGKYQAVGEFGFAIPIDTNELIEDIYVSPDANQTLLEVVNGLKESYELTAAVIRSNVNAGPTY